MPNLCMKSARKPMKAPYLKASKSMAEKMVRRSRDRNRLMRELSYGIPTFFFCNEDLRTQQFVDQ